MTRINIDPNIKIEFKGLKLDGFLDTGRNMQWFMEPDFGVPAKLLLEEPKPEPKYERGVAIHHLWTAVAKTIDIRHPDASVEVNLYTEYRAVAEDTRIAFVLNNLRDTTNPNERLHGFIHNGIVADWPGYEAAALYIAGLWSIYLVHEGLELTRYKTKHACNDVEISGRSSWMGYHKFDPSCSDCARANMVYDAHAPYRGHQHQLGRIMRDIHAGVAIVIGDDEAKRLLDASRKRAQDEVANEMIAWEPGT